MQRKGNQYENEDYKAHVGRKHIRSQCSHPTYTALIVWAHAQANIVESVCVAACISSSAARKCLKV